MYHVTAFRAILLNVDFDDEHDSWEQVYYYTPMIQLFI